MEQIKVDKYAIAFKPVDSVGGVHRAMPSASVNRVGVVMVLFNPDYETISEKVLSLEENAFCVLIDNSADDNHNKLKTHTVEKLAADSSVCNSLYIPLRNNHGIAFAQNIGIEECRKMGCTHVVFFDQDSLIPEGYVSQMQNEYNRIEKSQPQLFMLGPQLVEISTGMAYEQVKADKSEAMEDKALGLNRTIDGFVEQREIISSGTCVSMSKLDIVGDMLSDMFIDYVDFEICWRASAKGFVSGITNNVVMKHQVGKRRTYFLGRSVIVSSPFRYYYQYRNLIWLCRLNYVPIRWKCTKTLRKMIELFLLPFLSASGIKSFGYSWRGIKDGLLRR